MIRKKSEDAVSPVIGVMLMLVITILIAAVVAAFAGGLGADAEPAPTTVVDVVGISDGYMAPGKSEWSLKSSAGVEYLPGKFDGTILADDSTETVDFIYFAKNGVIFAREWDNEEYEEYGFAPYGSSSEAIALQNELMEESIGNPEYISEHTITLSCLYGDSLDLSKISVKVSFKNTGAGKESYDYEMPQNSLTGIISPGDTQRLKIPSGPMIEGDVVDVIVFYGTHKIAEAEELKVTRG